MSAAAPKQRKRPKTLKELFTLDAVKAELGWLNLGLSAAQEALPEPASTAEQAARDVLLREGVMIAWLTSSTFPHRRQLDFPIAWVHRSLAST